MSDAWARRIVALLLAVALLAGIQGAAAAQPGGVQFSDVDDDAWYAPHVAHIASLGITTGYPDGTFGPDQPVTRAHMAVFMVRAVGLEVGGNSVGRFADVPASAWYAPHVELVTELGITIGCTSDGTRYCPESPVTRAQMALYLAPAFGLPRAPVDEPTFDDVGADHPAYQAVEAVHAANIGVGCGTDPPRFCGTQPVTRAHMAAFLSRAVRHRDRSPSPPAPEDTPPAPAEAPPVSDESPPTGAASGAGCLQMFDAAFVDQIASAHPGARFTAAVHDHRTGCEHHLNPGLELTTASVIKAQVLAGVLLAAQDQGRALSAPEAADIELMMHYSHNRPPTSRLYVQVGGAAGMERLDARFGVAGTSHTAAYGATRSTAEDRTRLVEQLLIGGGPLSEASVRAAWEWMSGVSAAQSWGVTAGLPPGYGAALKNGFYPTTGAGWRLGTTGVVRDPQGGAYAMTVMTDNNGDEASGIALVEKIARHINAALTTGLPAERAHDLVNCVEPPKGSSWSSAAKLLGDIHPARLRRLNGGEASILAGQRVCEP